MRVGNKPRSQEASGTSAANGHTQRTRQWGHRRNRKSKRGWRWHQYRTAGSGAAVKEAADQALALQPQLGEAFVAQEVYRYRVLRDFQGALQFYAEGLERLPNSALVLEQMAHVE